ncbi:MAG: hypothetical protein EA360_08610 [Balneolaceae bacterium]|nr:MAG: hypothetical protein EA360_08610 [Balneolaceae bacterium]
MKNFLHLLLITHFFFLFSAANPVHGIQSHPIYPAEESLHPSDSLRLGLVLSGGGALGIAHIGVLEAIEAAGLRIDYITGTSMGSLIGGLYAIGYSTGQLREIALSNNFTELFLDRRQRKFISNFEKLSDARTIVTFPIRETGIDLPLGVIKGQNIYNYLAKLTWSVHDNDDFYTFPIPFAAIGTDIETGEAVVFHSGYLPDALRASISIPSIFTPHPIQNRVYVDGGLARNLPVEDVIQMGANYTIAVDVGTPLQLADSLISFSSILTQTLLYRVQDNVAEQKRLADYVIEVENIQHLSGADFDKAELLIELGRQEAERHLEQFKKLADLQSGNAPKREDLREGEKLEFSQIIIEGNTIYDTQFIIDLIEFQPFGILGPEDIEEKIAKIYSARFIDLVTYRVLSNEDDFTLLITIRENTLDSIQIGLRYESETKASLFLEGNFHNLIFNGSTATTVVRLGDRMRFGLDHIYFGALGTRFGFLTSLSYDSENVEWYEKKERISRFSNSLWRGDFSIGNFLSTNSLVASGIRFEKAEFGGKINPSGIKASESRHHALFLKYVYDDLHRTSYPVDGRRITAEAVFSDKGIYSPADFMHLSLFADHYIRINEFITLNQKIWAGYTTGRELPWNYWFVPNRFDPFHRTISFAGANRYQITSRNVQMASFGIQAEPFYHRFAGIELYAGRFLDQWDFDFSRESTDFGISLRLGALTIAGPIQLILSRNSASGTTSQLQIGYQF